MNTRVNIRIRIRFCTDHQGLDGLHGGVLFLRRCEYLSRYFWFYIRPINALVVLQLLQPILQSELEVRGMRVGV